MRVFTIITGSNWPSSGSNRTRSWLLEHTSGVALIQVRAFTNEERLRQFVIPEPAPSPLMKLIREAVLQPLDRGTQFFTTPLTGVSTARQNVMSYRNDAAVEMLKRRFTFDRLAQLEARISPGAERGDMSVEEARRKAFSEAQGFLRIFTFTCSNPGLEEVETLNWFLSRRDFQNIKNAWKTPLNTYRFNMLKGFFGIQTQDQVVSPAAVPLEEKSTPLDVVP